MNKENRALKWKTFLAAIIMAAALSVFSIIAIGLQQSHIVLSIILIIVLAFIYIWFIIGLYKYWKYHLAKDYYESTLKNKYVNLFWLIMCIIIMLGFHFIQSFTGHTERHFEMNPNLYTIICVFIFQVIFSSITEEMVSRALFLSIYLRELSSLNKNIVYIVFCVLASALISTLFHGISSPMAFLSIYINGILAAILYLKTRSVKYPILLHGLNNLLAWIALIIT